MSLVGRTTSRQLSLDDFQAIQSSNVLPCYIYNHLAFHCLQLENMHGSIGLTTVVVGNRIASKWPVYGGAIKFTDHCLH